MVVGLLVVLFTDAGASSVLDYSDLDLNSFKEEISKHDLIFVSFYFSWCPIAKRFAPTYEKAAKILA